MLSLKGSISTKGFLALGAWPFTILVCLLRAGPSSPLLLKWSGMAANCPDCKLVSRPLLFPSLALRIHPEHPTRRATRGGDEKREGDEV